MHTEETVSQEKTFITQYEQEDGTYAGPEIKARSWEEARAKAEKALQVIGELAATS